MLTFNDYLKESEAPLHVTHLTHIEDHAVQTGANGYKHAAGALNAAHNHLVKRKLNSNLSTKYDGSPAVVYGHHPENKKFFVATKSAFNANPKINYTHEDIERNHGHAPGLVDKLKQGLDHLPKIAPKHGVYQGDMMFGHNDLKSHHDDDHHVSFHPNPSGLTYHAHGKEAEKIKRAKIGIVTHLKYDGDNITSMSAHSNVDHDNFATHSDVHHVDPRLNTGHSNFSHSPKEQSTFHHNMNAAAHIHATHGKEMYSATERHHGVGGHLESYMNHTVRSNDKRTASSFKDYMSAKHKKKVESYKTPKRIAAAIATKHDDEMHLDNNAKHYNNLFNLHNHLTKAKHALIHSMNKAAEFKHTHAGEEANPEGYVIHHDKQPSKLINRGEFSRRNFAGGRDFNAKL